METLATGMQNLRIAQFFSGSQKPGGDDIERLNDGLSFIRRSLAAVSYLQEGTTEGLEPFALTEARYTSRTVRLLHLATDYPSFRRFLEHLDAALVHLLDRHEPPEESARRELENFFGTVGEAMVSEVFDGSLLGEVDVS